MTHGFDDQGSQVRPARQREGWWTPRGPGQVQGAHRVRSQGVRRLQVAPGQNLNGHLTLGENTADNGGIRIAYQALMETLAKRGPQGARTRRSMATRRRSASSSPSARSGARTSTEQAARVARQDRPAQLRRVARQGHRAELRRVRQGLRLQGRPAHDARQTAAAASGSTATDPGLARRSVISFAVMPATIPADWRKRPLPSTIGTRFALLPAPLALKQDSFPRPSRL